MQDGTIIEITGHAYDRAKERLSLSRDAFVRQAEKAYESGIAHSQTKGNLKKFMTKLWLQYKKANNMRIYGEVIYLFHDNTLITVYQLPFNLRKYIKLSTK